MDENSALLAVERQQMILEILARDGVVRNRELKELFNVSQVTIRSDLRELEAAGYCEIIWGGATSAKSQPGFESETLLSKRSRLHPEEKNRIGARAAQLVQIGQTIIVDAGTTTVELVNHLPRDLDYLRIVTPALNVASAAAHFPHYEIVMPGGILRHLTRSLIGTQVVNFMENVIADWFFMATGGYSLEYGITTSNLLEVDVKRTMLEAAERVVVLADSSKFGKHLSMRVTPLSRIDMLITDTNLSDVDTKTIESAGVEVLRV